MSTLPIVHFHGCYDASWRGLIVDDAFAHPAKFAPGLARRIVARGLELGWWRAGDLIGDPFGGIGGGGVMCASAGLRWFGVELEPRFVELARRNFALHAYAWAQCGDPQPLIVQGDSRRFASIVGEALAGAISSPPYAETLNHGGGPDTKHDLLQGGKSLLGIKTGCGVEPGQIGGLTPGTVDGAISSPPYADSVNARSHGIDWEKVGPSSAGRKRGVGTKHEATFRSQLAYGSVPGQIGALAADPLDGAMTSPPYGGVRQDGAGIAKDFPRAAASYTDGVTDQWHTQRDQTNIGNLGDVTHVDRETYWQAMAAVYGQLLQALKPGGVAAIVVKDYVKAKARVPLCDQTLELLTRLGFEPVERIHAHLVKTRREATLHGERVTTVSRKSFFRRLAEQKGSPRIDWEEVLVVRRPGQGVGA